MLWSYLADGGGEIRDRDALWETAAGINAAMRVLSRSKTRRKETRRNAISWIRGQILCKIVGRAQCLLSGVDQFLQGLYLK